mgnify:CR=1 FL=1
MADESSENILWFIAGAALGATIALLYAPASGAETRRAIGRKASESREKLAGSGRDVLERGKDLYEKGKQIAEEAADLFEQGRRMVEG